MDGLLDRLGGVNLKCLDWQCLNTSH